MTKPPPLLDRISDYAFHWADRTPDNPVFLSEGDPVTYRGLTERVEALARALMAAGIGKGDIVAMMATPAPVFMEVLIATASIGAVWIGLNPRFTVSEIAGILNDAAPKLIISQSEYEGTDFIRRIVDAQAIAGCSQPLVCFDTDDERCGFFGRMIEAGRNVSAEALDKARAFVSASDAAVMVYTSGSTGKPKGVMLSHHSLCFAYHRQIIDYGVVGAHFPAYLPINHVGGIGLVGCNPLIGGGAMYFMDRFDAGAVLALVDAGKVDCVLALSGMIEAMVAHPAYGTTDFSRIRAIVWGGASLSRATVRRLRAHDCRLATLYGMTEVPGNVAVTAPDATDKELTETVGRVSDYMDMRLVGEDGDHCAPGQPGEVRLRHSSGFLGYFGKPAETQVAFDEQGYFRTGDIGTLDETGNLRIVGRLKEMYKSGGYNVFPGEIENSIQQHPDIAIAAVVAAPDPKFQEVGWAYVSPRGTIADDKLIDSLARWCADRLANYKRPKNIVVMRDLPRLASGKTDKGELRRIARAALERGH